MDFKRLLGIMQYGFSITWQDGHRWIEWHNVATDYCLSMLKREYDKSQEEEPLIRSKVYGDYNEALDRIDEYLLSLGLETSDKVYIDFGGENN